jgi:hypothetical protein
MMHWRADVGASILLIGVGGLMIGGARGLPKGDDPLGPSFLPTLVGVALIGLALFLAYQALAARKTVIGPAEEYSRAGVVRVVGASITMAGLVLALAYVPEIGFPALSTVAVLLLTILFGGRISLGTLAFSALLSIAVYFVFHVWFKLPLPDPAWL